MSNGMIHSVYTLKWLASLAFGVKKFFFSFLQTETASSSLQQRTKPKFKPVSATDVIALQVELETWRTDCPFPSI